jgi:hypothetical protein
MTALHTPPSDAELLQNDGTRTSTTAEAEVVEEAGWEEDDSLPPPRGRIMTAGTWVMLMAACLAGGFALGARFERNHATSVARATVAAQLAQLRSNRGGFGGSGGGGSGSGGSSGGSGSANTPAATGTIQLIDGRKVYVQDSQGNIAIVTAPASLDISKLTTGERVVVTGTTAADGSITATAITPSAGGASTPSSQPSSPRSSQP